MVSTPIDASAFEPVSPAKFYAPTNVLSYDLEEVLITHDQIHSRIAAMAADISAAYTGPIQPVVIMKGAMRFYVDLRDALECGSLLPPILLKVTSFNGQDRSHNISSALYPGSPRPLEAVRNEEVLLFEDIVDEGRTMVYLDSLLKSLGPLSLDGAVLLDKPSGRQVAVPDYMMRFKGFVIPRKFVVGFGLDYYDQLRDMDHIGVLSPKGVARRDEEERLRLESLKQQ